MCYRLNDPRVLDGLSRHKRYLLHCAGSSGTPKPFQIYIVGQTVPIYLLTFWSSLSKKIFTKLLKPVFKILREKGHISLSNIDDCYLQGDTFDESLANV